MAACDYPGCTVKVARYGGRCARHSTPSFELSPMAAAFAADVIDGLAAGPWETWQDEGSVPDDEPIPRLEVYHSARIGWVEARSDPTFGGTFRVVCGPHGARALIDAIDVLADQRKAAREDGPAAAKRHAELMRGARALERKLGRFAAPPDADEVRP